MKNNLWNRTFHKKEVLKTQNEYNTAHNLIKEAPTLLLQISNAQTLMRLLELHQRAYELGFRNNAIDVNLTFRAKSIPTMTAHQVYLGGIYGLNTYALAFWEQYVNEPYGVNGFGIREDYPLYKIILNQYQSILTNAINSIVEESKIKINNLNKQNYGLSESCGTL